MKGKKNITVLILFTAIPLVLLLGITLLEDRKYNIVSMAVAFLACVPFFASFEHKTPGNFEIVLIAVMTALSVTGRVVFAMLPGFKPVTAITAITGIYFGPQAGFLTGALSALLSNIMFGQGPWTPFQMFAWGFMGFAGGILHKLLTEGKYRKIAMVCYGVFAGVGYSLIMDIWSVLSFDGTWSWPRYWGSVITAIPFTITYAVSNVVFLMLLVKPIGERLKRVKKKYGML